MITLTSTAGGVSFAVRVVPRSGRTAVAGVRGDALLVRVASAPIDDAANDTLVDFLAHVLDCPKRDVTIAAGRKSRDKRIGVVGVTPERVAERLSAILHE